MKVIGKEEFYLRYLKLESGKKYYLYDKEGKKFHDKLRRAQNKGGGENKETKDKENNVLKGFKEMRIDKN